MAKLWYEPKSGGTELQANIDPLVFAQTVDTADLALNAEYQGLSDPIRLEIAVGRGYTNLPDFDDYLQDEEWELLDRLDYYTYATESRSLTVANGAWFTPEAIEDVGGETDPDVAANSIDDDNQTFWRHNVNHLHTVTYRIRSYPKKVGKIRFRHATSQPDREQLTNLTVKIAKHLAQIDNPEKVVADEVNPDWTSSGWVEVNVADNERARYIKLEFETVRADNFAQVREFDVWVKTKDP